jgi:parallel beta-helix repeat protein
VNGTLDVQGTASNPVVFTSGRDDQYGGDSNGDGNGTLPAAGNWGYIKFTSQSNVTNTFDYCIVKYGGYSYDNVYYSRMLWITSANTTYSDVNVNNCNFSYAYADAIFIDGQAEPLVSNNTISDSPNGIVFNPSSTILTSPTIQNNIITKTTYPLTQINYSSPVYSGNTFQNNKYQAIALNGTISPSSASTLTWSNVQGLGLPYLCTGSITLGSNLTLTIPAGIVIKFGNATQSLISQALRTHFF